jgi:hypothetical protein
MLAAGTPFDPAPPSTRHFLQRSSTRSRLPLAEGWGVPPR